ncbi:MAG: diaminopimelate decarboxylase family protein [Eubacterium sp.]
MNNITTEKIIKSYATPLYVFEIDALKNRVDYLKSRLPKDVSLCYAIKANTFIVSDLCPYIEKLEVCSPGEMMLCLEKGVELSKIVVSGVYKTRDFIEEIVKDHSGVNCFTVESAEQYDMLIEFAEKYNKKIKLLLRLTSGNQFGLDEDDVKKIITSYDKNAVEIIGIQYFSGTQKTSLKRIKREIDYADAFLAELENEYCFKSDEFEYGPGLPVAYFDTDNFNEEEYLAEFSSLLSSMKYKAKITLEVGRSLVADCGNYITKVVDMKSNQNQNYAIVDGGMNHITYFGQSMAMKHPFHSLFPLRDDGETKNWNICGSLCTVNDILMKNTPMTDLKIGDAIVFKKTGAYCATEGISLFLSRDLPQVLIIDENGNINCAREAVATYKLNKAN